MLDAGAGIGVGVDQRERRTTIADDSEMLGMAGEPHEQDVAWPDIRKRLRHETLVTKGPQVLAIWNAAIGGGVEVEQTEFSTDADDQTAAIDGDALEPSLVEPGRAEP